ncbi:30S ribosomal protein S2 [Candidatus Saccharibacteria bacterium]|nr:MAG: 30S ribosomal protein S2 [Candidatus Saccharibacteria bacterium]
MATEVDIKQLLEAGAHFGHQTSRWHPKMAPYIHSKRGGSHIIDLTKTVEKLEVALSFLSETASKNRQILFVGTKRQAQDIVKQLAEDTKQPFVTERWLGGMLTNWNTIGAQIKHLVDLETKMASGELAGKYNKLEVQRFQEEIDSMNTIYGGIKELNAKPGAVVVFDIVSDVNAVKEAKKLGLPIVALVDTNADPTGINYPIPCNDDAIKALQLVADYMKQAIEAGKAKATKPTDKTEN